MISTVLGEYPWLSPTYLALLVVLGPPLGAWLCTRPRLAGALAAVSAVPVLLLTLVPIDRELFARCEVAWSIPTAARVELAANVVLFVAPVLLLAVALRRPAVAFVAGSATSVAIEVVQALATGLGRSCSTNDWLSNTIGAGLGAGLAWLALWLAQQIDASSSTAPRRA